MSERAILHRSHLGTRSQLITLRETMSMSQTNVTPSQPFSLLIILSHQAGVHCIDTLSYTHPAKAIHSNQLLLLVPNTHTPNSQRSLCCHQCIPCSSPTCKNQEIYMTHSTCCPCTYTAGRITDQGQPGAVRNFYLH